MTDTPPSIPQTQTSKKGLSPLAWVGIGCGGLIVFAFLVMVIGGILVGKKVKGMVDEAGGDPTRFAAEMVVKMNPEMDLVETDAEEGKLKIRIKDTGEEIALSYDDIANGKFALETAEGTVVVNAQDAASGMVITQADGETSVVTVDETGVNMQSTTSTTSFSSGTGEAQVDLPEWCAEFLYPQIGNVANSFATTTDGKTSGALTFTTGDSADVVAAFFKGKLEAAGYAVEENSITSGGLENKTVSAKLDKRSINITTIAQKDGKTTVAFYHESAE